VQILSSAFGEFLIRNQHKFLIVCGDEQKEDFVTVVHKENPFTTRLGLGWNLVCTSNKFKKGDTIRFKFNLNDPHKKCHVFKPTPFAIA
jgi:hypothetical protein